MPCTLQAYSKTKQCNKKQGVPCTLQAEWYPVPEHTQKAFPARQHVGLFHFPYMCSLGPSQIQSQAVKPFSVKSQATQPWQPFPARVHCSKTRVKPSQGCSTFSLLPAGQASTTCQYQSQWVTDCTVSICWNPAL